MRLSNLINVIDFGCTSLCIWESFEDFQKDEDNWEYINGLVPFKSWLESHSKGNLEVEYIGISVDMVDTLDVVVK